MAPGQFIHWENVNSTPIQHAGMTITPQAQAVTVRLPIPGLPVAAGFVWNRPVAVLVEQDGDVRRIPIFNLNRLVTFLLIGICLPILLLMWSAGRILR